MAKPTVHDIAREAGVSLATVDRVLNARPGVRAQTVARVHAAVAQLGYVRDHNAANLARRRVYRFAFVLPEGPGQFVQTLHAGLAEALDGQPAERLSAHVLRVPGADPHEIARTLRSLRPNRCDGVAVLAPETPQVRDAIAHLKTAGLPVVALASDLPNSARDYFVGIDNRQAGRTAAVLMGRFAGHRAGRILVFTNSLQARDSLERRLGFDEVMAARFPHLVPLPTMESFDDPERMARLAARAATLCGDSVGVYSMGAGNAPLLRGLREARPPGALTVIAHELTPVTRQALIDGAVDALIAQDVGHLVRSALRVLRAKRDGLPIFAAQERIRTEIVIRENLP